MIACPEGRGLGYLRRARERGQHRSGGGIRGGAGGCDGAESVGLTIQPLDKVWPVSLSIALRKEKLIFTSTGRPRGQVHGPKMLGETSVGSQPEVYRRLSNF